MNWKTKELILNIHENKQIRAQLLWYSYLDKYLVEGWKLKEIVVSYGRELYVYPIFEKEVEERIPKNIMGVDINLNHIAYTILDRHGNLVTAGSILLKNTKRALHLKHLAEELQKKYGEGEKWRFVKWARRVRRRWFRRTKNKLNDECYYISKKLMKIADKYDAYIVFEKLNYLKEQSSEKSRRLAWEVQLWCFRRIQQYTEYKVMGKGLKVLYVDAKNTSRKSPIGGKLRFINYRWVVLPNGVITTRDMVASWNLALRGLKQMRGLKVRWSPDSSRNAGMRTRPKRENDEKNIPSYLRIF